MLSCPHCSRLNPHGATFCYGDGALLDPQMARARPERFVAPFVFPSGRSCWSFDELIAACQDDWNTALGLFRSGALATFLAGLGRADLAAAARDAQRFPDPGRGLDQLLACLPSATMQPARLVVEPLDLDLGRLQVGVDVDRALRLSNQGKGLLHGTISSDVPWLAVGTGEGASQRLFQCLEEMTMPIRVRGKALRADLRPQTGQLTIESSGGSCTVVVRAEVVPVPFASGVLAGARSPRQLAEKAREQPREAARLFESGAVARWYGANGWTYPVEGEPVSGLAAVQQFFDALGLSRPARLELSQTSVSLQGQAGQSLSHVLHLSTPEKRPVYVRAHSNQPWLQVQGIDLDGSTAQVRLSIPSVPAHPGQTLDAQLTLIGNGRQTFVVPVRLTVQSAPSPVPDWLTPVSSPAPVTLTAAPILIPVAPGGERPLLAPPLPPPPRRRSSAALWVALAVVFLLLLGGVGGLVVAITLSLGRSEDDAPIARGNGVDPPKEEKERPIDPPAGGRPQTPRVEDVRPRLPVGSQGPPVLLMPDLTAREVEVVFCLDTTGSMGGLLEGARNKIWSICNQIAGGKPTPELKVGLVAYRDKNDEYVTRVVDLSRDLDAIHDELHALRAGGGGDTPEHVNQALDDAVNKIKWSTDKKTLRIIFLVGDAPPHMDYTDDVKYPETCKKAVEKGILINTVRCGDDFACEHHWKEIASKAGGAYASIPQWGGVISVATPLDERLANLGRQLFETMLIFGDAEQKRRGERMLAAARGLRGPSAADRAAYAAKSRRLGPYDLLDAVRSKRVKLEDVRPEHLPEAMAKLDTVAARQAWLEKTTTQRDELSKQILALEKERAAAIATELTRRGAGKDSFDNQVLETLRKQARKFDIDY